MRPSRPLRILVVHTGLHLREVESYEIYETVSGLVNMADQTGAVVHATDGRHLYEASHDEFGELAYVRRGTFFGALRGRYDVAHVHMVIPLVHLALAVLLRLSGARIVLSPMSMLGDDFGTASWFRTSSPGFRRLKPLAVRSMRRLWAAVTSAYVVQSAEEARAAHLPEGRWSLLPLPAPRTPLADAGIAAVAGAAGRNGPLAFVTRLDTWRKGLDRLCYWLDACRDELPRPAVVLYAPDDGSSVPELMPGLMADGLLRWDTTSRGADLVHELQQARGVGLLSRWDGQPRVLREAALLGLPTLSTPASHFADVVTALGTGVMVHDPDEPRAVQRAFEALATQPRDPEPARRLFHRDSVGETLLALLQAAGASPRPAPVDHYRRFATPTSATLLDG